MTKIPNSKQVNDLEGSTFQNELKKTFSTILENQTCLGHLYLEFEICLEFDV